MAGSFSQIYIQAVFAVKGRANLLNKAWRLEVFRYISGIIENKNQKSIIVNGVADHVHIFVGLKPSMSLSDLMRDVKNNATNFINEKEWLPGKFSRRDMEHFHIPIHSSIMSINTFSIKKNIIKSKPLKRNI